MRILLAEDDPGTAELLEMVLGGFGHSLEHAPDGDKAVEVFDNGRFDLALLDVMMPGRNGLEVLAHIRSHNRDMPVVMLTAKTTEDDHLRGYNAGADAYLTKPFDPDELNKALVAIASKSPEQRHADRDKARERARFLRSLEHRF